MMKEVVSLGMKEYCSKHKPLGEDGEIERDRLKERLSGLIGGRGEELSEEDEVLSTAVSERLQEGREM